MKIKKLAILGVGLIGGSIGKAVKTRKLAKEVVGIGRNLVHLNKAICYQAVDKITLDYKEGVRNADLVILCLPIQQIIEYGKKIFPYLRKKAVLTDVGSTKLEIVNQLEKNIFKENYFVGAHPMAGSEKTGIENAKENLFENTKCLITPTKTTNLKALSLIKEFWQSLGAKPILITPEKHDYLVAAVSHLPHLMAVMLVNLIGKISQKEKKIKEIAGQGFIDSTRIASSSSILWNNICFSNQEKILEVIDLMFQELNKIKKIIKTKDDKILKTQFEKAKKIREEIIKTRI